MRFLNLLSLKSMALGLTLCLATPGALAAGGGGDATAEEGAGAGSSQSLDQKEFREKTAKLNTLSARIAESERQFAEVVKHKAGEKNPEQKQQFIKRLLELADERNKAADEYMKLKSDLTLRYPNRGEHLNRRYDVQTKKTVEELEGAAGLDEMLTRTAKVIRKKYEVFEGPAETSLPVHTEGTKEAKPKRLRLER